jgi:hypothetical protein
MRREPGWHGLRFLPLLLCAAGCYSYVAVPSPVPVGTHVAVDLNDRGRADLGGLIGAEIGRVEGALVHNSDTAFVVNVRETRSMRGQQTRWGGETVSLRREYVRQITERRFSRSRTTVGVLAGAAGVLAFILSRELLGLGGGDISNVPPGGGGDDQ